LNIIDDGLEEFATVIIPPIPLASTDVEMRRKGTAEPPDCPNKSDEKMKTGRSNFFIVSSERINLTLKRKKQNIENQ